MKILLFASALALSASAAWAADPAQCDAKPFTLGKPAAKPDAVAKPAPVQPKPKTVARAAPKPQPRLLATCKDGDTKKG